MLLRRLVLPLTGLVLAAAPAAGQSDVPDLPRSNRDRGRLILPDKERKPQEEVQKTRVEEASSKTVKYWTKVENRYEKVFASFEALGRPSEELHRRALNELRGMGLGSRTTALKAIHSPHVPTVRLAAELLEDVGEAEDADVLVEVASGIGVSAVVVICLESALRLRGGWLPARAVRLLEHPKTSVRAAVETRLDRLPHEEHITPLLQLIRFGRDAGSRRRAARLLGSLTSYADVRIALRAALVDPAVPVALTAAESLVGTGRPEDVEFLLAEIEATAPGPELSYLLWGLLVQQESLDRVLVHEGMEQKLITCLGEPDIFLSGAAAACLAEYGFRSDRDDGFEYLDREVPHALVRAVGGTRFFPQYARLLPLAEASLRRITGVSLIDDSPSAWLEWLVDNLEGFRAVRGALDVTPADYARVQVGWHTGNDEWRWMGGPEQVIPQENARLLGKRALGELVAALEKARVLDVRMLPGTFGPESHPTTAGLEVQVGRRRKLMVFRGDSGQTWLPELIGRLDVLYAATTWQILAPEDDPRSFTLTQLPRWDSATPEERLLLEVDLTKQRVPSLKAPSLIQWSTYIVAQPGLADYWDDEAARVFLDVLKDQSDDALAATAVMEAAFLRPDPALTAPFLEAAAALEEPRRSEILLKGLTAQGMEVCSFCIRHEMAAVRLAAARALSTFGPEAIPTLTVALDDQNLLVVRMAVRSLGRIGDPLALPLLIPKAQPGGDGDVRREALWSLGSIGHPGALDTVVRGAMDPDPGVRISAIMALGELPGVAADLAFRDLFKAFAGTALESPFMRALEKRGAAAARRAMRPYLDTSDPILARRAALQLGALGDPAAAPVLVGMLVRQPRDEEILAGLAFTTCFDFRLMEDPAGMYTEWWRERGRDKPTAWLASSFRNLGMPVPENLVDAAIENREQVVSDLLALLRRSPRFLRPAISYQLNQLTGVDAPALRAKSPDSVTRRVAAAWQGWLEAHTRGG